MGHTYKCKIIGHGRRPHSEVAHPDGLHVEIVEEGLVVFAQGITMI